MPHCCVLIAWRMAVAINIQMNVPTLNGRMMQILFRLCQVVHLGRCNRLFVWIDALLQCHLAKDAVLHQGRLDMECRWIRVQALCWERVISLVRDCNIFDEVIAHTACICDVS